VTRRVNVHQEDIGLEQPCEADDFAVAAGFTGDLKAWFEFQEPSQGGAKDRVLVSD